MAKPHRVLCTRTDTTPEQALLIRVSVVIVLLVMVVGLIARVYRGQEETIGFWELEQKPMQAGDLLVIIVRAEEGSA